MTASSDGLAQVIGAGFPMASRRRLPGSSRAACHPSVESFETPNLF